MANLYDASCIAADYADLLDLITDIVLNYSLPSTDVTTPLAPANINLLGHHYFENTTTPTFNLDTTAQQQYGIALANKKGSMSAPSDAVIGQFNVGYGATTWLYLATIAGTVGGYTEVYRVNTAGGAAPSTCAGQAAAFEIQYSAQYYIYA